MPKEKEEYKVFTRNGKELCAYTTRDEGEDEEEATRRLLAYENHCTQAAIHIHKEWR